MRLRVASLTLVPVLAAAAVASHGTAFRAPQYGTLTAACTPHQTPSVTPPQIAMKRTDIAVWRAQSAAVASWTITPKNPKDWPWTEESFSGTPKTPATTPEPLPTALTDHPYAYQVLIRCTDGTSQTIDPDVIISPGK